MFGLISCANKGKSLFFFARVNDIVLSTETRTSNFFQEAGGWAGLGSIKFTPIGTVVDNGKPANLIAKPLFNTFTLNEYVPIGMLPSEHIICVFDADNTLHEYMFPINTTLLFRLIESNPDPVIFIAFIWVVSIAFTIGVLVEDHSKSHEPVHFELILFIETVTCGTKWYVLSISSNIGVNIAPPSCSVLDIKVTWLPFNEFDSI